MCFLRICVVLLFSSSTIFLDASSLTRYVNEIDPKELNLDDYTCEKDHPESYTLACFDKAFLRPSETPIKLPSQYALLEPVKEWISPTLLEALSDKGKAKDLRLSCETRRTTQDILYHFVLYKTLRYPSAAEKLSLALANEEQRNPSTSQFRASMIIFPFSKNSNKALAYLLGEWKHLYNSRAMTQNWGLIYAAQREVFQNAIKGLGSRNEVSANPQSSVKKKVRLAPLKEFDLQVGTEGLKSLDSLPKNSKRTAKAANTYKVNVPCEQEDDEEGNTVDALAAHGIHILDRLKKSSIDEHILPYIDVPIEDAAIIESLNRALEEEIDRQITANTVRLFIFPEASFWGQWGKSVEFKTGTDTYSKNFFDALKVGVKLNSDIEFKTRKRAGLKEKIDAIISLFRPFEHEGSFYSCEKGTWFKVEPTRLEAIKRKFRKNALLQDRELFLLYPYTRADEEGTGGLYAEDAYNKRIVDAWNSTPRPHGSRAILLDRLNIFLKGSYDKFEFADMVVHDDKGNWDIVHVKRRTSNAIDHHRNQVERTVDYLTTELRKDKGKGLFFESFLKALYETCGLSSLKRQRTELFAKASQPSNGGSQEWKDHVSSLLTPKADDGEGTNELKALLKDLDVSFFDAHKEEYIKLIDALRDCNKAKRLTLVQVRDALAAAQQAIELNELLFKLSESSSGRRKITLVMAVVDNRDIAAEIAGKSDAASRDTALFHLQDLWGLDRTCQHVDNHGFSFVLTVVNKRPVSSNHDVFGDLQDPESLPSSQVEVVAPSVKKKQLTLSKKRSHAKKNKAHEGNDKESDSEPSDADEVSVDTSIQRKVSRTKRSKMQGESGTEGNGSDPENADTGKVSTTNQASKKDSGHDTMILDEEDSRLYDYQYTPTDIALLLQLLIGREASEEYVPFCLNYGDAGENDDSSAVVHKSDTRYVFPPVYSRNDPEGACVEVITNFFSRVAGAEVTEVIIPFNCMPIRTSKQYGHWCVIHLKFLPKGDSEEKQKVNVIYYDSLKGGSPRDLSGVLAYLKQLGYEHSNSTFPRIARKQADSVSCGPITVENIKELFAGSTPLRVDLSKEDGFRLKKGHHVALLGRGQNFDFDR